ncbi:MAG TPA: ABC transporter ATP-binding protein [Candidatus Hydrogenedentes bacterium]|nr:ABC transporter ATP-binding protein [Candidatus Hydrogenedentota bacterium]HOL76138.1 ABC transporter ATP-binding protein [Candidatus Hydrogenedentota bacterium]
MPPTPIPMGEIMETLLSVKNLVVQFQLREGTVRALNGVSFDIGKHQTLGIVGESGCGKTVAARAILRILPPRAEIVSGTIQFSPRNHLSSPEPLDLARLPQNSSVLRHIRGAEISMIFQEPMSSLSPVHTVGAQIAEAVCLHQGLSRKEARKHSIEMLRKVGMPRPEESVDAYPHQLSGGLRQRAMIAMALSCRPQLLIADEPTTALDVTIQSQILDLLGSLQDELGMSVLFITHDLGVIAEIADEVVVMYLGKTVEQASTTELFGNPKHPYTQGLLAAAPRLGRGNVQRLASIPGSVPHPFEKILGCPFHPRCPYAIRDVCDVGAPPELRDQGRGHRVACHLFGAEPKVNESVVSGGNET